MMNSTVRIRQLINFNSNGKASVIKQVTTVLIREAPGPLWEASAFETISETR